MHRLTFKQFVAIFAVTVATLSLVISKATIVQASSYTVPFNANSIWNRPIGSSPALNPKSAQMIQLLASTVGTSVNIDGINGAWSVPVYYAPAGTPLKQVCDTNDYRPCEMVPVPSNMFPSPDSDAKTVIFDLSTNHAWSFYGMTKGDGSNGDWTALDGAFGWGYTTTQGDGIHNYSGGMWGGRVAGWNYYAGLIHPEEIQAGVINHAIAFFIPRQITTLNNYVWPAAGTDGSSTNTNSIPVGSRIQLDPSINVSTLPLTAGGKMIARALQVYGGWIADTGVAAAVDAQEFVTSNGLGINAAPWQGLLTYRDLYGIPVSRLRVVQVNKGDFYVEGSSPTPTSTPTRTNTPVKTPTPNATMPMSAPTVYDSMDSGAPDWKVTGGTWALKSSVAYNGPGLGWIATGATSTNILRWYRQIDLRNVPNAYLWVQSILSAGNTAYAQVSLDGSTWNTLGTTINPSSSWYVPSINLSAYIGKIIQLRVTWTPKLATDFWKFDDVTVGVLQSAQASVMQANIAQANVVAPTATPTQVVMMPAQSLPNAPASSLTQTIPAGYTAVESDASSVSQMSAWQVTTQPSGASGSSYLINTDPAATLGLPFQGQSIGVAFVAGPSFGQFTLEIDGAAQQLVNTNASDYQFGQVIVDGLTAGAHTLRVLPAGGVVGIDAFLVPVNNVQAGAATAAIEPTQASTNVPTVVDNSQLPTALPFPTLNVPVDAPSATSSVPTAEATQVVNAITDIPPTADNSQLPTALPFPTLNIPVDVPSATSGVPTTEPSLSPGTTTLPISTPTVYDSMDDGAPDWQATGNWKLIVSAAYNGSGRGWRAKGGTTNILRWNRQIDLRNVPNAHLWVQSILASADAPLVQMSYDGVTWTSIGTISVSSGWQVASVDLTPYVGQVIQLQFVWMSQNPADVWKFDDVTVGVLQAAAPSATLIPPTSSSSSTAVPTVATIAATATSVPPSPPLAQTNTSVPTQAPTLAPPPDAASTEAASS